jgi:Dolichyl-phosphate-mannose-protein mannosyltransferase
MATSKRSQTISHHKYLPILEARRVNYHVLRIMWTEMPKLLAISLPTAHKTFALSENAFALLAVALIVAGVFLIAPAPFIIDGGIYLDMARAMANDGSLAIAGNGGVEGAPALTKYLTHGVDGRAYPQYPSGYALLAAPFYKLMGVRGLILMNAGAAFASVWLTWRIAAHFYTAEIARYAAIIFALATFILSYAFSIWPHALSLAFVLGSVYCAVAATKDSSRLRQLTLMLASGLLIGAGINIRVDVILAFPILFLWLRLFAKPDDHISPAFLLIGMAPGLMLASQLNLMKFGAFSPFFYGPSDGADSIERYIPIMIAGAALLVGAWLINAPKLARIAMSRFGAKTCAAVVGIAALVGILTAGGFLWKILYGAYVLVINLQAHDAYFQEGVERNSFGQLLFWGYAKKALIQSLAFLPLAIIPAYQFLRGKHVAGASLCLLAIAAPVVFYSMSQWHGGGTYNMRYFIPTLPFIAILSAAGLHAIAVKGAFSRQATLVIIVAAAIAYFLMQTISQGSTALYVPAALYPQWVIAGVLAGLVVAFLHRSGSVRISQLAYCAAIFALSYSAFVNFSDFADDAKARAKQHAMAGVIARDLAEDALILSRLPTLLIEAEASGGAVMIATEANVAQSLAAAEAFERAGRCVYFHNSLVAKLLAAHLPEGAIAPQPLWAGKRAFPGDPRLAFFTLASGQSRCAF